MTGAEVRAHDPGMEATTKLQKAGRAFLRLIALHGLDGAARVLRALADKLKDRTVANVRRESSRAVELISALRSADCVA